MTWQDVALVKWREVATFRVTGDPIPQPKPGVIDNRKSEPWKLAVRTGALSCGIRKAIATPVRLTVLFMMRRPKSLRGALAPVGLLLHAVRPDIDNLAKSTMDALTELGVWTDDKLVCDLRMSKWYCGKWDAPGAIVTIETAPEHEEEP